jgi:plastocyanin
MTKKLLSVLLVFGLVGMAAVAIPALAKTKSVEVDDNYFVSKKKHTVTVHKGTKVKWEWEGSNSHNVTFTSGPKLCHSKSGKLIFCHSTTKKKGSYALTFNKTGTYKILCTVHAPGMKMTLKVVR